MKSLSSIAVLATAVVSVISAQTGTFTNFKDCATGPVSFTSTNGFSLAPSPLCISKPFCLTSAGALSAPITEGAKYVIYGRYLGRMLYTDTQDLCPLLALNGTPCPVAAGDFNLNICVNVKPNFPVGWPFDFQFHAINGNGELIFCRATPDYPGVSGPHPVSGLTGINCP
ncbi:hypothetical protein FBU30_010603 [Linnemannia zychae]|nr:hypothetical protein FBU30_010603 [Linnemannia zychae]